MSESRWGEFLPGRRLLQLPGPSNVPDEVLQALAAPTIDHRGPSLPALTSELLAGLRFVVGSAGAVVLFPGSGSGGLEAALVNTCSPGDRVVVYETGHFAVLWARTARQLGLDVVRVESDWRRGADVATIAELLAGDGERAIKALLITHNETSTGATSDIAAIRRAMDATRHPALLLVDAVSSLGSMEYQHDEWGVDVTVGASQKGLMLPPGLCINAMSERALRAMGQARLPRSYWDWTPMLEFNERGYFPYTPATNMLVALRTALARLVEEGLETVFDRHRRHAAATRAAVRAWSLELNCLDPSAYSSALTAVRMPGGYDEATFRRVVLERFGMSLGAGLGRLSGDVFRIGHLGDLDDLTLVAVLAGIELGLGLAEVPHTKGGVSAALAVLETSAQTCAREGSG